MEKEMERFLQVCADLESGKIRVAEKKDGEWIVNSWIKEVILSGFRLGKLADMSEGEFSFIDKDTIPVRKFSVEDKVRIVPGGSSVRRGAYLAPSVIMMPPACGVLCAGRQECAYRRRRPDRRGAGACRRNAGNRRGQCLHRR
mgnify:CR=1 FL=1